MSSLAYNKNEHYTWENYQAWPDHERWEIISGEAFNMSPSPGFRHQSISREISRVIFNHFQGKKCIPFSAPFDVKLSEEDIVQPDLLIVCDPGQIKSSHIEGAPSLIIEILSQSTEIHDRGRKMELYAKSGVKEFWIVTPFPSLVEILSLKENEYVVHKVFEKKDKLQSLIFPDLLIDLDEVFDFPLEDGEKKLFELKESPAKYVSEQKQRSS